MMCFLTDELDSSNIFAKHFVSVYTFLSSPPYNSSFMISFNLPSNAYFLVDDVYHQLSSLRGKFSPGLDGIPSDFLFPLRDAHSWPLWFLFRKSLDEDIYPSILKISSLLTILKSGDHSQVMNYRPTANLSYVAKMFKSLVLFSIKPLVNSFLIDKQHGFHPGWSTVTYNLVYTNFINKLFAHQS